ncbi:MAG: adenosylcobalamin-dependent ribonucleoside-diphosphate reductase [Chitinophagales bacterium]|nr:adenosylcobalamin-dependent ribonucleoside-diphosphate reductase [Chitinophagales bacterium]MDW8428878.1 adenosylcobalamin-dependent ribonucleoside-diphosphate reductase [Chitinophagales bacterium]
MAEVAVSTYTYEEVLQACLEYFDGDELAATTWMNKYAVKDAQGRFYERTPDDMHWRMAREFARMELLFAERNKLNGAFKNLSAYGQRREFLGAERIYNYFKKFRYIIPQGSVMSVLGNPHIIASLSNCVVLPEIYDSYGGIFFTDQQLAQLFKRRCGVGIDITSIRPAGAPVANAAGTTTGAVSFMERFSNTTREVAQHGRRGALMITMDVSHPDIEQFVTIKQDLTKVTGANVSVRLSDEFMQAVVNDDYYTHRWPADNPDPRYNKTIRARDLWQTIIQCAHRTAEPGLIFWDRQHLYSTSSIYPGFRNVSTNPCSEIAMQGGDSCRLIAMNLYSFVEHPFTPKARFDHEKFYELVYEAQRLSDDLVELELEYIDRILAKVASDPEPDYIKDCEVRTWKLLQEQGRKGRRTGLGFTALADTLAALNLKYDSDEALVVIEQIQRTKCRAEFDASIDMAIERGPFEAFNPEIERTSEFVQMLERELPDIYDRMMRFGRRNISLSTVAPTGTLSILAQTSSGIEPVYLLSYKRRRKVNPTDQYQRIDFTDAKGDHWQEFDVYHPKLKEWMRITGEKDITQSPYYGSTAPEIDWLRRIEIQAVVQKYVTHSISSTINLPSDVSVEKVGEIYLEAWRRGLKGITVYRDGSRTGVLVAKDDKKELPQEVRVSHAPKRPAVLEAEVLRFMNGNEKWMAVVGLLKGKPYEIFTGVINEDSIYLPSYVERGWVIKTKLPDKSTRYDFQYVDKAGYKTTIEGLSRSFNPEFWNYAKLISGVLRHGMPLPHVIDLVENLDLKSDSLNTWKAGVARALKRYVPDGTPAVDRQCPDCGDRDGLVYQEGCLVCKSCGHSRCG